MQNGRKNVVKKIKKSKKILYTKKSEITFL